MLAWRVILVGVAWLASGRGVLAAPAVAVHLELGDANLQACDALFGEVVVENVGQRAVQYRSPVDCLNGPNEPAGPDLVGRYRRAEGKHWWAAGATAPNGRPLRPRVTCEGPPAEPWRVLSPGAVLRFPVQVDGLQLIGSARPRGLARRVLGPSDLPEFQYRLWKQGECEFAVPGKYDVSVGLIVRQEPDHEDVVWSAPARFAVAPYDTEYAEKVERFLRFHSSRPVVACASRCFRDDELVCIAGALVELHKARLLLISVATSLWVYVARSEQERRAVLAWAKKLWVGLPRAAQKFYPIDAEGDQFLRRLRIAAMPETRQLRVNYWKFYRWAPQHRLVPPQCEHYDAPPAFYEEVRKNILRKPGKGEGSRRDAP